MEDDLNFLAKWKMTSILRKMKDNLNFKGNCGQPQFLWLMVAYLALASSELGTAQPHLVSY